MEDLGKPPDGGELKGRPMRRSPVPILSTELGSCKATRQGHTWQWLWSSHEATIWAHHRAQLRQKTISTGSTSRKHGCKRWNKRCRLGTWLIRHMIPEISWVAPYLPLALRFLVSLSRLRRKHSACLRPSPQSGRQACPACAPANLQSNVGLRDGGPDCRCSRMTRRICTARRHIRRGRLGHAGAIQ